MPLHGGRSVELSVQPAARWLTVISFGFGSALLLGASMLALGELFMALEGPVLHSLIGARFP